MTDSELEDLQDPEAWDWDGATRIQPPKATRVVASVGFTRQDFERVAQYARETGVKTSEFIREATLDHLPRPERTVDYVFNKSETAARGLVVTPSHEDLDRTAIA